jgi:hypothetical protein
MKAIFQLLIDAGKLKKVMDETGKTIENLGAFGGWRNNIGNLNTAKGYKVNVTASSTLSLEGTPIQLPFDIALNAGWNIISYPSASIQDAKALVQSLIDAGKLKKVMDEAGKTIENLGAFGGWRNNIGNFIPGKGYKVNVTQNCILTIPAEGTKSANIVPEVLASSHFKTVFKGNGTDHMNIHLINLQVSGLQDGDEIGIYDGKLCVGSATIGVEQLIAGSISIPASASDNVGKMMNGFSVGHPITLKLFRNNQEYNTNVGTAYNPKNVFAIGESLFVVVNLGKSIEVNESNVKCYPNPFSEQVSINIQLPQPQELDVTIYDVNGKLVRNLFRGRTEENNTLIWNGRNNAGIKVVSGVYFVHVNQFVVKTIKREHE